MLTNIVYAIMITVTIPKVMNFADGMKLLDMLPTGYNEDYVNSLLNALGSDGRNAYLFQQIPLDLIYPCLFGVTYCLVFAFIIKKINKEDSFLFYLCFVPVFAGIFDYLENIGIITMLKSYPDNSTIMTQLTNIFSILKSTLTAIYFVTLIIALLTLLTKYIISRNEKTTHS
ncbi:hypothetical protein [Solitalea lacus]|uniref:hypothetical protein n=1 Tax=Solitalea lacus TaxID=2911172 RepID=UPI001EDBD58B|nr:hypothetical protein [Solitalea lacus]UKJ08703.1 hypothetical protein L2B55_05920 [Solitalea lacus]